MSSESFNGESFLDTLKKIKIVADLPSLPPVDPEALEEEKTFGSLDSDTKDTTIKLRSFARDTSLAEFEANLISQQTRRTVLWLFKWPLIAGGLMIVALALIVLFTGSIVGIQVSLKLILKSPKEIYELIQGLNNGVLILTALSAPIGAIILTLAAWLFRAPVKKKD